MENFWLFFSFPLNILLAVLWLVVSGWMWKHHSKSGVVRFLLSTRATVSALTLLLCGCLWIGCSGERGFAQNPIFVIVLLYVQTVLYLVTLRGWRRPDGAVRWRFLLIHAGLLIALGSGFWGSPDSSELRTALVPGETTNTALNLKGKPESLGYELLLIDYKSEISSEGTPSHYEAKLSVDNADAVLISVNHPYSPRFGEDIYLASVTTDYCILQIVREPWRYFALAGIVMLIAGAFLMFIKGPGR